MVLVARGYAAGNGKTAYFEYSDPEELIKSLMARRRNHMEYRQNSSARIRASRCGKTGRCI